ncbi:MAG: hypothetical protein RLZZ165_1320 [Bacteroidota bacterium]
MGTTSLYGPLLSFRISHSYYLDGICKDFEIVPTVQTQQILRTYEIAFRPALGGFELLRKLNQSHQQSIPFPNPAPSLIFLLKLLNPRFLQVTDTSEFQDLLRVCMNRQGLALNLGNAGFDEVEGGIPIGIVPPVPPQVSGDLGSVRVPQVDGVFAVLTLDVPPSTLSTLSSRFVWTLRHMDREVTYYVITPKTSQPTLMTSPARSSTCVALASIPEDGLAKRITETRREGKRLDGFRYRIDGVAIQQTTQLPSLEMGGLQPIALPLPRPENNFTEIIDLW